MAELVAETSSRKEISTISLVAIAHGTSHFFHLMLPPLFPYFIKDFGLSYTKVALLMTAFFMVSGTTQIISGFVVDRCGANRTLFSGIALLALSGLTVFLASDYSLLMLAAVLSGLGNGVIHPADYTIINCRISHDRLGYAFSVHSLSGMLGWSIAPGIMHAAASTLGWHQAGLVACLTASTTLAILIFRNDLLAYKFPPKRTHSEQDSSHPGSFGFLKVKTVWLCLFFFMFSNAAFGALQNFSTPLLMHFYSLSSGHAISCLTGYLLGTSAGVIFGGFLAQKNQAFENTISLALGTAALVAFVLATGYPPGWGVLPLLSLMGFSVGIASPSRQMMLRESITSSLGPSALGRAYGFVFMGSDSGLALAPLMFGPLMDAHAFSMVFAGIMVLQCSAVLAAFFIRSRRRVPVAAT
ncbi:MAG: MFS transporter [Betaproteobacteria bacterium]|nr:MFS transporter [Betaproteobacteria bacterium]